MLTSPPESPTFSCKLPTHSIQQNVGNEKFR